MRKPMWNVESQALVSVSLSLSRAMIEYLHLMSDEKKTSVSILISRAIYNEMGCKNPFNNDLTLDEPFDEEQCREESKKLYNYIRKYPGLNLEHFVLHKIDVGLKTKREILISYRLLLHLQLIEEYPPKVLKRNQSRDYRLCRATIDQELVKKQNSYRNPITKGPLND